MNTKKKYQLKTYRRSWIVFFLSIVCTILIFVVANYYIIIFAEERFNKKINEITNLINLRLDAYKEVLIAGQAFFYASNYVDRDEWYKYISWQKIDERYPGIQGVGFQKHTDDKETFLQDMEELRSKNLLVRNVPEIDKDGYYNYIIFLEPVDERNLQALGYDMSSEPTRRDALLKAVEYDTITISGKITLVQEITEDVQPGFLMYAPLYEINIPYYTVEERHANLLGYVYAAFRMGDFMENLLPSDPSVVGFTIHDETNNKENLLYNYDDIHVPPIMFQSTKFTKQVVINNFERDWIISFHAEDTLFSYVDKLIPITILVVGFTISILLFFISNSRQSILFYRQKQLELVRETNKQKDEFSAMVTHELRTPLTPILGNVDYLILPSVCKNLTTNQKEAIESIQKNALHLNSLISDILDAEKLNMNKMKFDYTHFDVVKLLNQIKHNFSYSIKEKNVVMRINIEKPLEIYSDQKRLQQVLENLINNSLDFIPNNTGKIEISILENGNTIKFSVKDNGKGISPKEQKQLFKKFYQVDTSLTRKHGGTGLGLVICKGIIEGLRGKIWIESELGLGTTIFFTIPRGN